MGHNLTRAGVREDAGVSHSEETIRPLLSLLGECAVDTERHVARSGWDQPVRLFAIARNGDLARREPSLAAQLEGIDPDGYSTIEQPELEPAGSLEETLAYIAWPPEVDGAAIAVERIVVPPAAERDLPDDPQEAVRVLAAHPDRQDVRLFAAVLRDGEAICLLRQRAHDSDDQVAFGNDIAPGLVAALAATFEEPEDHQGDENPGAHADPDA